MMAFWVAEKHPRGARQWRERTVDKFSINGLLSADFWQSLSLDALAEAQGIKPMDDISVLFGTWPGDPDDEFEEMVGGLRKRDLIGGIRVHQR